MRDITIEDIKKEVTMILVGVPGGEQLAHAICLLIDEAYEMGQQDV